MLSTPFIEQAEEKQARGSRSRSRMGRGHLNLTIHWHLFRV